MIREILSYQGFDPNTEYGPKFKSENVLIRFSLEGAWQ